MADTAVARLRGILAATMTRTAIDTLLDQVTAELAEQAKPIPYALTDAVPRPAPPHAGHLALCGRTEHHRDGTVVSCAKAAEHASPWHRDGAHNWRSVFGTPGKLPKGGHGAHELGELRATTRDLGAEAEQLRATLREVRSDLVKLYASLPDGLDFYLGRIRITRLRIDAALEAADAR